MFLPYLFLKDFILVFSLYSFLSSFFSLLCPLFFLLFHMSELISFPRHEREGGGIKILLPCIISKNGGWSKGEQKNIEPLREDSHNKVCFFVVVPIRFCPPKGLVVLTTFFFFFLFSLRIA